MARPERKDVDYFPFYVKDGRTLFILENKYGCMGTGFFTNIMRFLCQTPDHHFCINDDSDRLFFFSKTKCDEESGTAMLDLMAKTGKIYGPLWVSSRVIVSPDLLTSLKDAYVKRKNTIITIEEIIALYTKKIVSDTGNTDINEFPTPETTQEDKIDGKNSAENPQSKVKETKLKESKVDNNQKGSPLSFCEKRTSNIAFTPIEEKDLTSFSTCKNPTLKKDLVDICNNLVRENIFPGVLDFTNLKIKQHCNLEALLHTLKQCYKYKPEGPDGPRRYCLKIIGVENGNYTFNENIKKHEQVKKEEMRT